MKRKIDGIEIVLNFWRLISNSKLFLYFLMHKNRLSVYEWGLVQSLKVRMATVVQYSIAIVPPVRME